MFCSAVTKAAVPLFSCKYACNVTAIKYVDNCLYILNAMQYFTTKVDTGVFRIAASLRRAPSLSGEMINVTSLRRDLLPFAYVFKDIYLYFAYPCTLPKIFICVQLLRKKLSWVWRWKFLCLGMIRVSAAYDDVKRILPRVFAFKCYGDVLCVNVSVRKLLQ